MDKVSWKEIVRKTKWDSKKKRLGKRELGELMKNATELEKFMGKYKSSFQGTDRTDPNQEAQDKHQKKYEGMKESKWQSKL